MNKTDISDLFRLLLLLDFFSSQTESFFDALSKLRSVAEMRFVLIEVMVDISMHSHVEEEILYPTLRLLGHPLADHAQEEHLEVAKLVADLETRAVKDPTWVRSDEHKTSR